MRPDLKKLRDQNQAETQSFRRGQPKPNNNRGRSFGNMPLRQPKNTGMDPASPNFEPAVATNGRRWEPYPTAAAAGCTYSNPLTRVQETVSHLQTKLEDQRMTAEQEVERMKEEFATTENLRDVKMGLMFEALDLKDEIRQNRENVAATRDAVKNDLGAMYQMMKTLQSTTARLEKENKSMLAVMQSQVAIEAAPTVRMIQAAPEANEDASADMPREQTAEKSVDATTKPGSSGSTKQKDEDQAPEKKLAVTEPIEENAGADTQALVKFSATKSPSIWLPHALRALKPCEVSVPSTHIYTFSYKYLQQHLGGGQRSPGLAFSNPSSLLRGRAYWLLEAVYEPFAPVEPGHHGAKLTPFFSEEVGQKDYADIPVFVSTKNPHDYTYMGHYSQPRYSDKLSDSEMVDNVPARVLRYWNENLADASRPEWLTKQLMEHLSPRPIYSGSLEEGESMSQELGAFCAELRGWEIGARVQAEALTEADVAALWEKADADLPKGLRFWWEYLECVSYDHDFYQKLVEVGCEEQQQAKEMKEGAAKDQVNGVKTAQQTSGLKNCEQQSKQDLQQEDNVCELQSRQTEWGAKKQTGHGTENQEFKAEKPAEKQVETQAKQKVIEAVPFDYGSTFTPRKKRANRS